MSEAQEIQKGWNWGKMLLFTFFLLHKIQLGLSMISFRPSLVYFRILYIVQCLLTWWIKKILARGRMSHSNTSLWERMKENPQISLSIIYLECIQHFNWWWSSDKLSLQATSYHIWFCPHWLVEGSFKLTNRDKKLCNLLPWETCSYDVISILTLLFVTTFRIASRFPNLPILLSKQTKGGGGRRRKDWKSLGAEKLGMLSGSCGIHLWYAQTGFLSDLALYLWSSCSTKNKKRARTGSWFGYFEPEEEEVGYSWELQSLLVESYWKIAFEIVWVTC